MSPSSSGIDWFDLDVNVRLWRGREGRRCRSCSRRWAEGAEVRSSSTDGTIGLLPEEWLQKYAILAGLGDVQSEGGTLRFGKVQVGFLDAMIATLPQATIRRQLTTKARGELGMLSPASVMRDAGRFVQGRTARVSEGRPRLAALPAHASASAAASRMTWAWARRFRCLRCLKTRRTRRSGRHRSLSCRARSMFNWQCEARRSSHRELKRARLLGRRPRSKNVENFQELRSHRHHLRHAASRHRAC